MITAVVTYKCYPVEDSGQPERYRIIADVVASTADEMAAFEDKWRTKYAEFLTEGLIARLLKATGLVKDKGVGNVAQRTDRRMRIESPGWHYIGCGIQRMADALKEFGVRVITETSGDIQVLIALNGKLCPFRIAAQAPNDLIKLGESTDDGAVGDFFAALLSGAADAITMVQKGDKDAIKWGFKVEVDEKTEEGHEVYKIKDDPLGD